jgi:Holliday junction resolvase RusA-like endonuclease
MNVKPLSFKVVGIPVPQGSKTAFMVKGRPVLVEAAKGHRLWRSAISHEALLHMEGREMFAGPVQLELTFEMPRLKRHFRPDGTVKASAPKYVSTNPDLSKLVRNVEDGLQAIVFRNDSQVAKIICSKVYADREPGVTIVVRPLPVRPE